MQSLIAKRALNVTVFSRVPMMSFATKSSNPLGGKEKGDEKQFFNKEDEKLLKGLLKKMQQQAKAAEGTPEQSEKSVTALKDLFKKHKIDQEGNKAFFEALVDWKKQL